MATTQYIGARYVPLFYTAPDNSNDWTAGVAYDPLTIVTYLNQSYTSKIPVPATVGNPADNPTYWILTGNYNAQVQQYLQQVQTLSQTVSDLPDELLTKKRAFFVQSDSLGAGIISNGVTGVGWRSYFKTNFSDIYDIYDTSNVPASIGAGVTGFNSTNKHITNLRWSVENELEPAGVLNDITDLIVLSGTNDAAYGTGLYDAIEEYVTYARSVFKNTNLRIVIGCCAHRVFNTRSVAQIYYKAAKDLGCEFATDLLNIYASVDYTSDNTHYTQAGYDLVNPYIVEYIITGHTYYDILSTIPTDNGTVGIHYLASGAICLCDPIPITATNTYLSSVHFTPTDTHIFDAMPWSEGTRLWKVLLPDGNPANLCKFPNESYFRASGNAVSNPIINGTMYVINDPLFIPIERFELWNS